MPAVNPRRECPCRTAPLITDRFQEAPIGRGHAGCLGVTAALLGTAHVLASIWEWGGVIVLLALDAFWLYMLWFFGSAARAQARHGVFYVRLDAPSFELGGSMGLRLGNDRGAFAGLHDVEAWLRCVDTFVEERETGRDGETKSVKVCYVVWEDQRQVQFDGNTVAGELRFDFKLPLQEEFASPWGTWNRRRWEVEVDAGRGAASTLVFSVRVA
jgi:hypothetical protein